MRTTKKDLEKKVKDLNGQMTTAKILLRERDDRVANLLEDHAKGIKELERTNSALQRAITELRGGEDDYRKMYFNACAELEDVRNSIRNDEKPNEKRIRALEKVLADAMISKALR